MAWELTWYSLAAFASATVFLVLMWVGWRRRDRPMAPAFVALMAGGFTWSAVAAVRFGFSSVAAQQVWQRLSVAASGTIPPLFLVFSLRYAGRGDALTRPRLAALALEAAAFAGLAVTNGWHHLLWRPALETPAGSPAPVLDLAPVFYAHAAYAYVLVLVGLGALGSVFFTGGSRYTRQTGVMILGAMPPFLTHVAFTLRVGPVPWLDLTPFAFVVTGVLWGFALFSFDLLERTPIAQQRAIELVGDGLLVVGRDGTIVDTNEVSRRILDLDPGATPSVRDVFSVADVSSLHGSTRTVSEAGERRAYDVLVSELTDQHGAFTGYAVVLRDVTDRYRYEERLEVANRVLRHNLRNDMNVILGNARLISDATTEAEIERYASNVEETATDLVALSEKARELSELGARQSATDTPVSVTSVVTDLVAEFRDAEPDAEFEVDAAPGVTTKAVSKRGLEVAVRNLLENAVEHCDESPVVRVAVTEADGAVRVSVHDDGPGLPRPEQDLLRSGTETPLQHSAGLGLWLTNWVVRSAGGTVAFETGPDHGTSIVLSFGAVGD